MKQKKIIPIHRPLHIVRSIEVSGTSQQTFDAMTGVYEPDFTILGLTLRAAFAYINMDDGQAQEAVAITSTEDAVVSVANRNWWHVSSEGGRRLVVSNDWSMTLRENLAAEEVRTYEFTCDIKDKRTGNVYALSERHIVHCSDVTDSRPRLLWDVPQVLRFDPLTQREEGAWRFPLRIEAAGKIVPFAPHRHKLHFETLREGAWVEQTPPPTTEQLENGRYRHTKYSNDKKTFTPADPAVQAKAEAEEHRNLLTGTEAIFGTAVREAIPNLTTPEYAFFVVPRETARFITDKRVTISFDLRVRGKLGQVRVYTNHHAEGKRATNIYKYFTPPALGEWQRVSATGFFNLRTDIVPEMSFYSGYGSGIYFDIRRLKLEVGETPTEWTPSAQEIASGTTPGLYSSTIETDSPIPPVDFAAYTHWQPATDVPAAVLGIATAPEVSILPKRFAKDAQQVRCWLEVTREGAEAMTKPDADTPMVSTLLERRLAPHDVDYHYARPMATDEYVNVRAVLSLKTGEAPAGWERILRPVWKSPQGASFRELNTYDEHGAPSPARGVVNPTLRMADLTYNGKSILAIDLEDTGEN